MTTRWTVGRQFFVGLTLISALIVAFILLTRHDTRKLLGMADSVLAIQRTLGQIEQIFDLVKEAEARQRDYVLTGNDGARNAYRAAVAALPRELDTLRAMLLADPEQVRRLDTLKLVIARRLVLLNDVAELRRTQGFDAALERIKAGEGSRVMEVVRGALIELRQVEEQRLEARDQQRQEQVRALDKSFLIDGLLILALSLAVALVIGRSLERKLHKAIAQVQGSSADLHTAAGQQVSGAREQAASTTEISITVKQLLATSRQIAGSAQQVARVADDTAGAAQTGKDTVQRAQEAIDVVNRQVDAIVTHMLDLGKRSQEIGGILDIINDLSEQTNILAINATIESAGAGEYGKRFAVVADEIRKLADRVGGATKDIRMLIDEIRAASNTTIMATEDGSKAVQSSARSFGEVAGNFRRISELVRANLDLSREIEISTQQQTMAVEQVNTAILEVAQTARQAESSSAQTMQTAQQLSQLSAQLNAILDASVRA